MCDLIREKHPKKEAIRVSLLARVRGSVNFLLSGAYLRLCQSNRVTDCPRLPGLKGFQGGETFSFKTGIVLGKQGQADDSTRNALLGI